MQSAGTESSRQVPCQSGSGPKRSVQTKNKCCSKPVKQAIPEDMFATARWEYTMKNFPGDGDFESASQMPWSKWERVCSEGRTSPPEAERKSSCCCRHQQGPNGARLGSRKTSSEEAFTAKGSIAGDVNRTPHRAQLTRTTHASFSRVHVAQDVGFVSCLVFLKSHSISSMFRGTLLEAFFTSSFSTPFPTLAPSAMTAPSLLCPSTSSTAATPQGGFFFRWRVHRLADLQRSKGGHLRLWDHQGRDHKSGLVRHSRLQTGKKAMRSVSRQKKVHEPFQLWRKKWAPYKEQGGATRRGQQTTEKGQTLAIEIRTDVMAQRRCTHLHVPCAMCNTAHMCFDARHASSSLVSCTSSVCRPHDVCGSAWLFMCGALSSCVQHLGCSTLLDERTKSPDFFLHGHREGSAGDPQLRGSVCLEDLTALLAECCCQVRHGRFCLSGRSHGASLPMSDGKPVRCRRHAECDTTVSGCLNGFSDLGMATCDLMNSRNSLSLRTAVRGQCVRVRGAVCEQQPVVFETKDHVAASGRTTGTVMDSGDGYRTQGPFASLHEVLMLFFDETGRQLESQKVELNKANQLSDQAEGE